MSTQLKFDGASLEEVLERVGRELGPQAVIVEANRGRRGGVGGFFAREWFEVVVEAPEAPVDPTVTPASSEARTLSAPLSDAALLALADDVDDEVAEPAFAKVLARVGGSTESAPPAAPVAGPSSVAVATPAPLAVVPAPVTPAPVAADPVPPRRSPSAAPAQLRDLALAEMLARLDRLAPAPTTVLGRSEAPIVAVVGDPSTVRAAAASVARRAGLDESDVLVASVHERGPVPSWMRIDGPAAAASRVERWRRSERPVVIAVDLTPGRDGHAWAADVLAAIGADEVRLVVRAWQVTDEIGPKAAILGADGLELVEVEAAAEPENFLDLSIPVHGIDGRPATPDLWAALLVDRRNDVAV